MSRIHAKEMAWCASSQLKFYGGCRFRFIYGVFPRCATCPLFDAERAINDVVGENPPPTTVFEIEFGPNTNLTEPSARDLIGANRHPLR